MIDVLRASTTIATAVAGGAAAVVPTGDIDSARRIAASLPGPVLTGGERGGLPIDGFDLGNSPLEYSADRVLGRSVVITTTNGTAALDACRDAAVVLIGAIVNRAAVGRAAREQALLLAQPVHLVCAGTDGEVTEEDLLGAGAILDAAAIDGDDLDPAAARARELFRRVAGSFMGPAVQDSIVRSFAGSAGGRNLIAIGMEADLPVAAAIDSLDVVPVLDARGRILAGPLPR